jgi:osmotically-inducible protein OsmY
MEQEGHMFRTDEQIKTNIVNRLSWDTRVDASDVMVAVNKGVVRLRGTVPLYPSLQVVLDTAAETPGVIRVENDMSVLLPDTASQPDDEALKHYAEYILDCMADLNGFKIRVLADQGVLTLQGAVPYFWQRQKAAHLLGNVVGVRDIHNEITVVPTHQRTDETIAQEIVEELKHSDSIPANSVVVSVNDGKVTLSGTVPHVRAVEYAVRAASHTRGVRAVDNQMDSA